jgi:hypothetical protein
MIVFRDVPDGCIILFKDKKYIKIKSGSGSMNVMEINESKMCYLHPDYEVSLVKMCNEVDHERFWYGDKCVLCELRKVQK